MTISDGIGSIRYISLTTYHKDATAVATPVWHVANGGRRDGRRAGGRFRRTR